MFTDRVDAGRRLADLLLPLAGSDPVVLALPRGGIPVAAEIARALQAQLDVLVVRKLGVPYQPELAMGALGEDGVVVWNDDVRRLARVSDEDVRELVRRETDEVRRRARLLRGEKRPVDVTGRTAVVVDDGAATGSTALAGCRVVRARGAARIIVAVPVAPSSTIAKLAAEADEVVTVLAPASFSSVGQWYEDFSQLTDDEAMRLIW